MRTQTKTRRYLPGPASITAAALLFAAASQASFGAVWTAAPVNGGVNLYPQTTAIYGGTMYVYSVDNHAGYPGYGSLYQSSIAHGQWGHQAIYTNISAAPISASAQAVPGHIYVAHVDADRHLRLTQWSVPAGWQTVDVDGGGQNVSNSFGFKIATAMFGGKLYMFYNDENASGLPGTLRYATYDGSNHAYGVIDAVSSAEFPAAVVTQGLLYVYYYDFGQRRLRFAGSASGSIWLPGVIDAPKTNFDDIGRNPSVIVNGTTTYLFYNAITIGQTALRSAVISASGVVTLGTVDTVVELGTKSAPVIHAGGVQVYYTALGDLRAAWGAFPNGASTTVLDGPGGIAVGATPSALDPYYITAAEFGGVPSIFALQTTGNQLRNIWYQ